MSSDGLTSSVRKVAAMAAPHKCKLWYHLLLAKSRFSISIKNSTTFDQIFPIIHWAIYLDLFYPEINLLLLSYTSVFRTTRICCEPDRVKIGILLPFPPYRPEKFRKLLPKTSIILEDFV